MAGFAQVAAGTECHLSFTKVSVLLIDSPPLIIFVIFHRSPIGHCKSPITDTICRKPGVWGLFSPGHATAGIISDSQIKWWRWSESNPCFPTYCHWLKIFVAIKGIIDCVRKTIVKEGVLGLYAGAASPLLGAMAHNAGVTEWVICGVPINNKELLWLTVFHSLWCWCDIQVFYSYGAGKNIIGGGKKDLTVSWFSWRLGCTVILS